jgi:hypothetical protein
MKTNEDNTLGLKAHVDSTDITFVLLQCSQRVRTWAVNGLTSLYSQGMFGLANYCLYGGEGREGRVERRLRTLPFYTRHEVINHFNHFLKLIIF